MPISTGKKYKQKQKKNRENVKYGALVFQQIPIGYHSKN